MPEERFPASCERSSVDTGSTYSGQRLRSKCEHYQHLLDLEYWYLHAANDIGKKRDHVIVAHGHVGDNLLQSSLLGYVILVLLAIVL